MYGIVSICQAKLRPSFRRNPSCSSNWAGACVSPACAAASPRWSRLAPAFDLNPNIDKAEHVLNIDDVDNRPSLATVLSTASFYRLAPQRARKIVAEVTAAVDGWDAAARRAGISAADIELSASAFAARRL